MGVLFTPLAETDLEDIGDYIAQDNPARALSFIQEIRAQCQKIGKSPLAGDVPNSETRFAPARLAIT